MDTVKSTLAIARFVILAGSLAVAGLAGPAAADAGKKPGAPSASADYIAGAPADPSQAWNIAAGGRLYDQWWTAIDKPAPKGTHPAYPKAGKVAGPGTFRCKECHGWDYRGRDGVYRSGSHYSGIAGIRRMVGAEPAAIAKMLRTAPHNYTPAMIGDAALARLALFVSLGQHDTRQWIDERSRKARGNLARGKGIFQTTCAACHGFDGRLLNWGSDKEPEFVGTAATKFPEEVLHKIRNGHPGANMINLRMFSLRDAASVLAYAQTLPVK